MSDNDEKPRILALDVGSKRTGVAISDETRSFSFPRTFIEATDKKQWAKKVAELLEMEEVGRIVVGLPLNQHGEAGQDAVKVREYIAVLSSITPLPVVEWDERFTTAQAERALITADVSRKKRKGVIDQVAAAIILQSYLDSLKFRGE